MIQFPRHSLAACVFLFAPLAFAAEVGELETLLPDDVVGYVRLSGAGARLEDFLKSDLLKELEATDLVRGAYDKREWKELQKGLADFRAATGKDPVEILRGLLGKEALVGARIGFGGPEIVLLTRTAGEKVGSETLDLVLKALAEKGVVLERVASTYADHTIETLADKLALTSFGPVLAVSNSKGAVERVIDLATGRSSASVKKSPHFKKAPAAPGDALITAVVRPRFIPNFHVPDRADNGLGSLLAGGWLAVLEASDLLSAAVSIRDGNVELKVTSVLGESARDEKAWQKYASFFPSVVPDGLRERLEKRGLLGFVELRRNLAQWWENREALLTPKAAGDLVEFSQIMSIVFGGRNFQDEVLPEFGPSVAIVARNQDYPGLPEKPKPAIPAFAAVFQLKDAAEFGEDLEAAFQTIVGIINADQAQKKKEGGMTMRLKPEKVGEHEMFTVALRRAKKGEKPGMMHNFTPSMAVVGNRVIVSSSSELTRVLIEELTQLGEKKTGVADTKDALIIDGRAVRSILEANLDVLVADNMMKKGISKAEAEGELKMMMGVLAHVKDLQIESRRHGDALELGIRLATDLGRKAGNKAEAAPAKGTAGKREVKL